MQLERRRDLANGRQGRFQAACRLGRDLPAQAKSDKSQGVRGTESPDSINQTLKKNRETRVRFFGGSTILWSIGFTLTVPPLTQTSCPPPPPRSPSLTPPT